MNAPTVLLKHRFADRAIVIFFLFSFSLTFIRELVKGRVCRNDVCQPHARGQVLPPLPRDTLRSITREKQE